jgi:hypothetical protein
VARIDKLMLWEEEEIGDFSSIHLCETRMVMLKERGYGTVPLYFMQLFLVTENLRQVVE